MNLLICPFNIHTIFLFLLLIDLAKRLREKIVNCVSPISVNLKLKNKFLPFTSRYFCLSNKYSQLGALSEELRSD